MIKAIVFDFDGTLADSIDSVWQEYRRVARIMRLKQPKYREFTKHLGRTWEEILKKIWPDVSISEFMKHYRAKEEKALPIKGASETLEKLKKKYTLAIMTSRGRKTLSEHIKTVGLNPRLFRLIAHRESLENHKPDPRALLQVCAKLKLKPSEILYIGDAILDAECAFKAGVPFVGVLTGGASRSEFKKHGIEFILKSVNDMPLFLEGFSEQVS